MKIKALLIQIRQDHKVISEERLSFQTYAGLRSDQIDCFNVFENPRFDFQLVKDYDCLFVGGASEASVLEPDRYHFVPYLIELLQSCVQHSFPVFASCFGFQAAVLAQGGVVTRQEKDFEMGTYPISLSVSGSNDPVFRGIKSGFQAISVHQEKCTELPPNCELLAYTENCIHSFRIKDKPFWTFQFHPELNKKTLTSRLQTYQSKYTENAQHFQRVIDNLQDTPDSNRLVGNFVDYLRKNAV